MHLRASSLALTLFAVLGSSIAEAAPRKAAAAAKEDKDDKEEKETRAPRAAKATRAAKAAKAAARRGTSAQQRRLATLDLDAGLDTDGRDGRDARDARDASPSQDDSDAAAPQDEPEVRDRVRRADRTRAQGDEESARDDREVASSSTRPRASRSTRAGRAPTKRLAAARRVTTDDAEVSASVTNDADEAIHEIEAEDRSPAPRAALATRAPGRSPRWQLTVGPYLWASAVDANVSLGSASVGAGIDFIPLQRHAKYGAEVLAELRRGRLTFTGDLMYGAVAINGEAGVGPVMASITGNASSLLVDGAAGYAVLGDDEAPMSLELRGGVRYQRTAVSGELGVAGQTLQSPESVAAGSDAVVGARAFVRPSSWLYLSGVVDAGVFGASNATWSASADLSVRATSFLLVSLGYRTLTLDRAEVNVVMHGPRAAVQWVF